MVTEASEAKSFAQSFHNWYVAMSRYEPRQFNFKASLLLLLALATHAIFDLLKSLGCKKIPYPSRVYWCQV